jgi:hypothetical protein
MWAIIKFDKKKLEHLKIDFSNKLGKDFKIYNPKLLIQRYKKDKLVNKEFSLLGDYLFCYHKDFYNPLTLKKLQFCRGLKMILNGFIKSQNQIDEFIKKCKALENEKGHLSQNFYQLNLNTNYKFVSGPFSETIFKIVSLQKNKIDILMGNLKTSIKKGKFLFSPA